MPCCSSSITPALASAKPWQYAFVISGWKDLGRYDCLAKGKRNESVPLWSETASALRRIIPTTTGEDLLFRNTRGAPLTRDGVAYRLGQVRPVGRPERPPRWRNIVSRHMSCGIVVRLHFCRRAWMFP